MTKDYISRDGRRGLAARDGAQGMTPLDLLRDRIDAVAAEPAASSEQTAGIADWVDKISRSGVLRRVPLSADAMELLAQLVPPASVTEECRARLERERLTARAERRARRALEAECHAASPAELFRGLRERAGMTAEYTAGLFGVTATAWIAVETKQRPWYQLPADALPVFAAAIHEPLDRLLALIALTARRALYHGIERRANLALGRFDASQGVSDARRDTLRIAFARIEDENRGAAVFLKMAHRGAEAAIDTPVAPKTRQQESDGG